ncbi:Protein reprimo A [Channa argus]|uniref:Protein reprimo A n=1 Tax=Channa argus TaxID=215402 RepID=A0A6G1PXC5_CHAAH|nr:Protein reprimo A [Channa argus]
MNNTGFNQTDGALFNKTEEFFCCNFSSVVTDNGLVAAAPDERSLFIMRVVQIAVMLQPSHKVRGDDKLFGDGQETVKRSGDSDCWSLLTDEDLH